MIQNPAYYGAIANCKKKVASYKDKRVILKSQDDWIIVEDTHEPIVSKEIWLEAQKIFSTNKKETVRRNADGEVCVFAGIIKCADCGANMVYNKKPNESFYSEFFRCGTYLNKGKNVCPPHRVNYKVIYEAVLIDIQRYAALAIQDEEKLIKRILKANNEFKDKSLQRYEKTIRVTKNRIKEIDGLLQSVFEEKLSGTISEAIFKRMATKYEGEQSKLIADLEKLETEFEECKKVEHDLSNWIKKIKSLLSIDTITRTIAVELIDRIEVLEVEDKDDEKTLEINIFYKFGLHASSLEQKQKNRAS